MKARWWVALGVASLVVVSVLGLLATQVQLSGDKDRPCGTALRIDLRQPTLLRDRAADLEGADDATRLPEEEVARQAGEARAEADALENRCKTRQQLALLGLGVGAVTAAAALAWCTYQLGRRAGEARAHTSG